MSQPRGGRCGVVGDPIAHSLSPVLHRAGYAALGLDWEYDAWQVGEGSLVDFVATLADWRGLSVTAPLKREALVLASTATDRARLAGVANTLVREDDEVRADNTDIAGAVAFLCSPDAQMIRGQTVIVDGGFSLTV